jgi:glutaminase
MKHTRLSHHRSVNVNLLVLFVLVLTVVAQAAATAADIPSNEELQRAVDMAHEKFKGLQDGANADYIPILAEVPSELFGVAIVTINGDVVTAGDVDHPFSIQSVSKPFVMAMVMQDQGIDAVQQKIGVEPTGMPFNSIIAIELNKQRSINPLVNAGAIAAVSMIEAADPAQRWAKIERGFNDFAGEELSVLEDVYTSEAESNFRNVSIAYLLYNYGRLYSDPLEAVDVYTRQCSIGVNAAQLAMMGATLANGGVNPKTGKELIKSEYVDEVLSVMMMAGFYDESGLWSYEVGLPGKTGVGGGIVVVVPGQMAIAAFSPRLNEAGNSVRAMGAIKYIAEQLNYSIYK